MTSACESPGLWLLGALRRRRRQSYAEGRAHLLAAIEAGYTFFDHADIYCNGRSEELFGCVLREVSGLRSRVLIGSKCGAVRPADCSASRGSPYRYDSSGGVHIIEGRAKARSCADWAWKRSTCTNFIAPTG